ncbi:MAG: SDR family NAD(P)-dependent oxidoreductase [Bacteroidetes bacterium]|nr:SDR family NAD(P)-dependent oxidoreductase [Bacteroidota bacterium]
MELDLSFFNDKRILITGGGGYLGSKFAVFLATTHAEIYLLDVKFNEIAEKLNTEHTQLSKVVCDLTNKDEIESAIHFAQPDLIFHFAALLNRERDFSNYEQLYKVNVEGTLNLLEGLKRVHYSGLYYASSSEVYGNNNPSPFREDQNPSPASPYSLTKLMAESLISTYSQINGKPYTILRIFNFYGPQMPPTFFLSQLEESLNKNIPFEMTGGEQKRDFIYIDDLIELMLKVASESKSNQDIINMCSGQATSIKELAIKTASQHDKLHLLRIGALPYRANEIWEMVGDNRKILSYYKQL